MDLRFRAWDKISKKMKPICFMRFTKAGNMSSRGVKSVNMIGAVDYRAGMSVVIMQWTGLVDKNGVDIYDGDIINYEGAWGVIEVKDVKVVWRDNGFYGQVGDNQDDLVILAPLKNIEVVGNIYENPKLLGKEVKKIV